MTIVRELITERGGAFGGQPTSRSVVAVEAVDALYPPDELDSLDIHPSMRLRIDHALAGLPTPYLG